MKKVLNIILLGLMLVMSFSIFAGCNTGQNKIYEHEYFNYIIINEDTKGDISAYNFSENKELVIIVGFTELGLAQESLDIPNYIEEIPVSGIGFYVPPYTIGATRYFVDINETDKLKKIYVHENIDRIVHLRAESLDVMLCNANINDSLGVDEIFYESWINATYLYKSIFDKLSDADGYSCANITYINYLPTHKTENYYRLDNVEKLEKIIIPPEPTLKGYDFLGWYTEVECINKFDFDVAPNIENGEELKLYANWAKQ